MEEDLQLGLYVIVVLCFIVIAMAQYKLAYQSEYATGTDPMIGQGSAASMRFAGERETAGFVGSSGAEAPSFWNMGSVEETNAELQKAAAEQQKESFGNKRPGNFTDLESFAGHGY